MTMVPREPDPGVLLAYVKRAFPDRVAPEIANFHEISAGWESDVYAFDLLAGSGEGRVREPLVLRIYPGTDAHRKSALEFRALRDLYRVGYPVPRVLSLAQEVSPFDHPFLIMARVPGRGMWRETFSGPENKQRAHFERFMELFVRLHRLSWRDFVDEAAASSIVEQPYLFVDRWLAQMRAFLDRFGQPGYAPVLDWLVARRELMACERPAPIHWDYHPNNILGSEHGTFVIDWTQFEVADPRFDLAWTMTLVGSEEGDEVRDRIRRTYERMIGAPVANLDPFEVFACAKRLASVTLSLSAGAEQFGMRAGAEAMMRRQIPVLRHVYDRLRALTGLKIPEVDALLMA
jgi:aminoglycoside phosphotransferase (APT) family kinase protein